MVFVRAAGRRAPRHTWALVLAGGSGSRLRGRTLDSSGHHVPKQYCLIDGRHTLLQLAVARALRVVDPSCLVVAVLNQHREWWEPQLEGAVPPENVVSQPLDRGTGVGVLSALLEVLARDSEAHVVVLPADHHFRNERRLARAIRRTLEHSFRDPGMLIFVGIEPQLPTSDFGYLVPGATGDVDPKPIAAFVEKPPAELAERLIRRGALWNTFIFAAFGQRVSSLIRGRFPREAAALHEAAGLAQDPTSSMRTLAATYPSLATIDLSRDVLECADCPMAVTRAAGVGWSELGTPERITRFWREVHAIAPTGPPELHPPWSPPEPKTDLEADLEKASAPRS